MGQDGSETLIIIPDGQFRVSLAPTIDKLLYPRKILTGLSIGLDGLAYHYTLHLLASNVVVQKIEKLGCRNSGQPVCNYLQGVGHCYSCALLTIVYRKNTH